MKYAILMALLLGGGVFFVDREFPQVRIAIADLISLFGSKPAPSRLATRDPMQVTAGWTSITTRYGQVISITKVTSVDERLVHYQTPTGAGTIELASLPDDVRDSLGYDPAAAGRSLSDEQARESLSDATAAKVQAQTVQAQEKEDAIARAEMAGPVSDSDYAAARSDMDQVTSNVVIDSGTGVVSGDTFWVQRYWVDRRRMEAHEQHERAAASTTASAGSSSSGQRSATFSSPAASTAAGKPRPGPAAGVPAKPRPLPGNGNSPTP